MDNFTIIQLIRLFIKLNLYNLLHLFIALVISVSNNLLKLFIKEYVKMGMFANNNLLYYSRVLNINIFVY